MARITVHNTLNHTTCTLATEFSPGTRELPLTKYQVTRLEKALSRESDISSYTVNMQLADTQRVTLVRYKDGTGFLCGMYRPIK
jgi:hypothetical protein